MATENEDELSTKNEPQIEVENMKPALSKMTDANIQNVFGLAFGDFQRSNHENRD